MHSGVQRLDDQNIPRAVDNAWLGVLSTPSNIEIVDLAVTATATLDALVTIFAVNQFARSIDGGARWERIDGSVASSPPLSLTFSPGAPGVLYVGTTEGVFSSVDLGDTWTLRSTGLPDGIFIERLVSTSDPAVIYAMGVDSSGSGRLFRTTNLARSWEATAVPAGFINGFAVHPSDPQTVYVGHDQSLSRTTDGGATWTRLTAGVDADRYSDVAFDPRDTRVVYASANQRVLRSTDGGTTWERLVVTQNFYTSSTAVAIDPLSRTPRSSAASGWGCDTFRSGRICSSL